MGRSIDHQIDEPVLASIGARWHRRDEPRSYSLGDDSVLEPFSDTRNMGDRCDHLEARDIDMLTESRPITMRERDHTARGGERRGRDIGLVACKADRGVGWVTDRNHRAAEGARHEIIGSEPALGPRLTKPADRGQHELRMIRGQLFVPETQCRESPDRKRFEDQIRVRGQRAKPRPIRRGLEIELDASLIRIRIEKGKTSLSGGSFQQRRSPWPGAAR